MMSIKLDFRQKEYTVKVDARDISGEPHYLVFIFLENALVKKGHFRKIKHDITSVIYSSNHTFDPTEYDNNLLYAVIEKLVGCYQPS